MIDFLLSVNKISFLFFLMTLVALIYEYYLFKREKSKNKLPQIPQFEEKYANKEKIHPSIIMIQGKKNVQIKTPKRTGIIIALIITSFIAIALVVNFFVEFSNLKKKGDNSNLTKQPIIKTIESPGIIIYNKNFELLNEERLKETSQGAEIIIGIKTVSDPTIDKARIRINKDYWSLEDEVNQFDEKRQVYYRFYKIATNETQLKIEGQLHSTVEGWLGE